MNCFKVIFKVHIEKKKRVQYTIAKNFAEAEENIKVFIKDTYICVSESSYTMMSIENCGILI